MWRGNPAIPRRHPCRFTLAATLMTALLLPQPAPAGPFDGLEPAGSAQRPAWAEEFKVFDGTPRPLAYIVETRGQAGTFLVAGTRPKDDRPAAEHPLLGRPEAGDWVFEDGTAAIRVFGVPPPEPGKAIVLAASFAPGDPPSLRAIRAVAAGNARGRTVGRAGDFVHFSLPATKRTCSVAVARGGIALTGLSGLPVRYASTSRVLKPNTRSAGVSPGSP